MLGNLLRELLGLNNGVASAPASKKGMLPKARQMQRRQEDDGMVRTNKGTMPLSQVSRGQAWATPNL